MPTIDAQHDVYHEGELAVQERADAVAQAQTSGRVISDTIIRGAIKFTKKQPFVVMASVDQRQNLWASIVVGRTGFVAAEPHALDIDVSHALQIGADPFWRNVVDDHRVGILVIDLRSRARLRVNGRASFPADNRLHVDVAQAYPNCPQYIQRRNYRPAYEQATRQEAKGGTELNDEQRQRIAAADTLFVASEHPSSGLDASHRGGNPGFIQVVDSSRLRIPDYAGNGMFNTLGNFAVNPRAGLIIPDFEKGRTLQLTGRPKIQWDTDDPQNQTGGTRRYWDFEIHRWIQTENSLPGSTEFLDFSPHNPVASA